MTKLSNTQRELESSIKGADLHEDAVVIDGLIVSN